MRNSLRSMFIFLLLISQIFTQTVNQTSNTFLKKEMSKSKDYDRPLKDRKYLPITTFSFLFGEMVQYMSSKSSNDKDFDIEEKLSSLGYPIGEKVLELCSVREKNFKKETKIVNMLQFIHNNVWKMLFGKQADGLQKSTDDEDEYRIIENSPITNKYIPFQKGQSNCASFLGGIIEGILNSADFRCKVSTFFFDVEGIMKTYYIIKFDHDVIVRDANMK